LHSVTASRVILHRAKELLSDAAIRATKPTIKDVRLFDGNGFIFSSSQIIQDGGDLITPSTHDVKPYL
jgi:hypothetical protein